MIVVFDTTVFFTDPYLNRINCALLHDFRMNRSVTLVVPQIVLEETVNHFRLALAEEVETARKALSNLADRLQREEPWRFPPVDIAQETASYESTLKQRFERWGIQIVGYDDIPLKSLVDRALRRQKPFDACGKVGFRDAIIWETVLGLLKQCDCELILVTKNKNDFGAEHIAPDLAANVAALGTPKERVLIVPDLKSFVERFVTPTLKKVEEMRKAIENGVLPAFDAISYFQSQQKAFVRLAEENLDPLGLNFDPLSTSLFRSPRVTRLDPLPSSFQVDFVFQVDASRVIVDLTYYFQAEVTCSRFRRIGNDAVVPEGNFTGRVSFDCPITVEIDLETGEASEFDNNTFGWSFGPEWSEE